jgi:hypothetical protein
MTLTERLVGPIAGLIVVLTVKRELNKPYTAEEVSILQELIDVAKLAEKLQEST